MKNYPNEYIYQPWKASERDQKIWGCVLGQDYPHRLVDHDVARNTNMDRIKYAYDNQKETTKLMKERNGSAGIGSKAVTGTQSEIHKEVDSTNQSSKGKKSKE